MVRIHVRAPFCNRPSGLWCNSSISAREADGPGANPGFLTKSASTVTPTQEDVWNTSMKMLRFFEITSKRRKGFPSETSVKKGVQIVRGTKELHEKLGRNDLCPCESGRRFQKLLHAFRTL